MKSGDEDIVGVEVSLAAVVGAVCGEDLSGEDGAKVNDVSGV